MLDVSKLIVDGLVCGISHHSKKDQHGYFEPCPIEERFRVAYAELKAALQNKTKEMK